MTNITLTGEYGFSQTISEAERNSAAKKYMDAHPCLDYWPNRRTFEAGFDSAWNLLQGDSLRNFEHDHSKIS